MRYRPVAPQTTAASLVKPSETLLEPNIEKTAELGCRPELRNRVQVFERGCERVRQAPDCTRFELVVLRLKIQIVHTTREVPGNLQFAFDERLIDDHLCRNVSQFRLAPELDLFAYGLEI